MATTAAHTLLPKVSFVVPAHNAARTVGAAVRSAAQQAYAGAIEVCVYDDGSADGTAAAARAALDDAGACAGARAVVVVEPGDVGATGAHGPGFARNRAVEASTGEYLAMLDADDVALPGRVTAQLAAAAAAAAAHGGAHALVGGGFVREPADATPAYTAWANGLTDAELYTERFREVTLVQPTWLMHRSVWDAVGGYDEALPPELGGDAGDAGDAGAGILGVPPRRLSAAQRAGGAVGGRPAVVPEDPIFFHRWLAAGGRLARAREPVIVYTYSGGSQSWRTPRDLLLRVKAVLWEEAVLRGLPARGGGVLRWPGTFTIWGAGRDGKAFYKALSPAARARVAAFADVDPRKVGQVYPQPVGRGGGGGRAAGDGGGGGARRKRERPAADGTIASKGDDSGAGAHDAGGGRGSGASRSGGGGGGGGGGGAGDPPVPSAAAVSPPGPASALVVPDRPVPILHYTAAVPPIVCCVALAAAGDELRANVASMAMTPGVDFWYMT